MAQGVLERFDSAEEETRLGHEHAAANIRVAIPGIIQDFNAEKQTATVQPAITENVRNGQDEAKPIPLPLLTDVPVIFPRSGGYCLTFPVKPGDECLLVFSDMCIDGWWQSSGIQNQIETRRHDLSDAQAFLGITSVPKAVTDYSINSVMLRNEDKDTYFEILDDDKTINIIGAETINVTADDDVTVKTNNKLDIEAENDITIKTNKNLIVETVKDIAIKSSENLIIETVKSITITANAKLDIKSVDEMTITSDKSIVLTAPIIETIQQEGGG